MSSPSSLAASRFALSTRLLSEKQNEQIFHQRDHLAEILNDIGIYKTNNSSARMKRILQTRDDKRYQFDPLDIDHPGKRQTNTILTPSTTERRRKSYIGSHQKQIASRHPRYNDKDLYSKNDDKSPDFFQEYKLGFSHLDSINCIDTLYKPSNAFYVLTGDESGILKLWNFQELDAKYTVKPVISYRGNIGPIYACLILDKDTYISGGADGKIRIFKKPPPEDLGNFDSTFYFANRVIDPAPDTQNPIIYGLKPVPLVNYSFHILLVCYDDGFVRLWNLDCENDADVIVDSTDLKEPISTVATDSCGFYLIGTKSGRLIYYDGPYHKLLGEYQPKEEKGKTVYCSCLRTNKYSYCGYENGVLLINDWEKNVLLHRTVIYKDAMLTSCSFYNNSLLILTSNNRTINFYDINENKIIHCYIDSCRYKGPESIKAMGFVTDMAYIILCCADGVLKVYRQL